jgi:hypothetical protein
LWARWCTGPSRRWRPPAAQRPVKVVDAKGLVSADRAAANGMRGAPTSPIANCIISAVPADPQAWPRDDGRGAGPGSRADARHRVRAALGGRHRRLLTAQGPSKWRDMAPASTASSASVTGACDGCRA